MEKKDLGMYLTRDSTLGYNNFKRTLGKGIAFVLSVIDYDIRMRCLDQLNSQMESDVEFRPIGRMH